MEVANKVQTFFSALFFRNEKQPVKLVYSGLKDSSPE